MKRPILEVRPRRWIIPFYEFERARLQFEDEHRFRRGTVTSALVVLGCLAIFAAVEFVVLICGP